MRMGVILRPVSLSPHLPGEVPTGTGYGHPQFRIRQDSLAHNARLDSHAASWRNGMRRIWLAVFALAASHGGALAADLPARSYTKAPVVDPGINWSGFYAGINAGYGRGSAPTSLAHNDAEAQFI